MRSYSKEDWGKKRRNNILLVMVNCQACYGAINESRYCCFIETVTGNLKLVNSAGLKTKTW
jgi:hypothetical protein